MCLLNSKNDWEGEGEIGRKRILEAGLLDKDLNPSHKFFECANYIVDSMIPMCQKSSLLIPEMLQSKGQASSTILFVRMLLDLI